MHSKRRLMLTVPCSLLGQLCGHLRCYDKTPEGAVEALLVRNNLKAAHCASQPEVRWATDDRVVDVAAQRAASSTTSQPAAAAAALAAARAAVAVQTQLAATAVAVAPVRREAEGQRLAAELATRLPARVLAAPTAAEAPAVAQAAADAIAAEKAAATKAAAAARAQANAARFAAADAAATAVARARAAADARRAIVEEAAAVAAGARAAAEAAALREARIVAAQAAEAAAARAAKERAAFLQKEVEAVAGRAVGTVREADALLVIAADLPGRDAAAWRDLNFEDVIQTELPDCVQEAAAKLDRRIVLSGVTDYVHKTTGELLEIKIRRFKLLRAVPNYERAQMHGYMYLANIRHMWHAQVYNGEHEVTRIDWDETFWQKQMLAPLCAALSGSVA